MATHQRMILLCCLLCGSTAFGDMHTDTDPHFSIGVRPLLLWLAKSDQAELINLHAAYRQGRNEFALELSDWRLSHARDKTEAKNTALRWKRLDIGSGATGGPYYYLFAINYNENYFENYGGVFSRIRTRDVKIGVGLGYKKFFGQASKVRAYMEAFIGAGRDKLVEKSRGSTEGKTTIGFDLQLFGLGVSF